MRKSNQNSLTKKRFEALLTKAAQPLKPDSKVKGTSVVRHADGYIGKRKSRGKIAGKEG